MKITKRQMVAKVLSEGNIGYIRHKKSNAQQRYNT
jgi:hypothetical protein